MPTLSVRRFEERDIEEAAHLLAARQKRDRLAGPPGMSPSLESAETCEGLLRALASRVHADGAVAQRGGAMAGFLFGERMLLPPTAYPSMYVPPHSISIPVAGHAVTAGEDVLAVYRALYAELSGRWVREGFFVHQTHIFAGDAALQEAWVTLGFGRHMTAAVRPVGPVEGSPSRTVAIHRAGSEDLDVVMGLSDTLNRFHSQPPMFWPLLETPRREAREHQREMLEAETSAYFVAYDGGRPIAMQTFMVPGFTPAIALSDGNVYLYEGVVEPEARSGGVGTALLSHAMDWAANQGYEYCTLHFASGNPSGGPFWLGHGFRPVEYGMTRHVDERVAWANGW